MMSSEESFSHSTKNVSLIHPNLCTPGVVTPPQARMGPLLLLLGLATTVAPVEVREDIQGASKKRVISEI